MKYRLTLLGRMDHLIKIGGENVDFASLEGILQTLKLQYQMENEMTLLAVPHERLGHTIHLVAPGERGKGAVEQAREAFDQMVLPFERIRQVHWVKEIPKSALSKILRKDLLKLIMNVLLQNFINFGRDRLFSFCYAVAKYMHNFN